MFKKISLLLLTSLAWQSYSFAQVVTTSVSNATPLIQHLAGPGVKVSNGIINCAVNGAGTFTDATSSIGMSEGIVLTTAWAEDMQGPNDTYAWTRNAKHNMKDTNLYALDSTCIKDVCFIEFDVVPECEELTMDYVFGSEEWPEYACCRFNDAFGFFVSGPGITGPYYSPPGFPGGSINIAYVPGTTVPVGVNSINGPSCSQTALAGNSMCAQYSGKSVDPPCCHLNQGLYIDNGWGTPGSPVPNGTGTQMDGYTVVLTAKVAVQACKTYHMKIIIGDASDYRYDSGVFLKEKGLSCPSSFITLNTTVNPAICGPTGSAGVTATGGVPPYTYSWSNGATTDNVTGLSAGVYTVHVSDGCHNDSAVVTVTTPGDFSLSTSQTNPTCSGSGNDGTASVTPTALPGSAQNGPYTYSWAPGGQTDSSITGLSGGQYIVTVTGMGCTHKDTVVLSTIASFQLATTDSNISCNGANDGQASVTITGGNTPFTYAWSPSGGTGATATNLAPGKYCVTVTDNGGCVDSVCVTLTEPSKPIVTAPANVSLCLGKGTTLTASASGGTAPYTYDWNNGTYSGSDYAVTPTLTTTYTVIATDANGCPSDPKTVTVTIGGPLAAVVLKDTIICPGETVPLRALGSGGDGNFTYSWVPGGQTTSTISVTPPTTTTYTVTINDGCGTPPVTAQATVTVNPLPTVLFKGDTLEGCVPLCVNFTDQTTPASASCFWDFGDGITSDLCNPTHCYTNPGAYSVKLDVTDVNGCKNSLSYNSYINVYAFPDAQFTMDPQPATIFEPMINFTDQSVGTQIIGWEWEFGDSANSTSTVQNPNFIYGDTGTYKVKMVVTNQWGCTDTVYNTVFIFDHFVIYFPDAFTPNDDGFNEVFMPKGVNIDPDNYELLIFDRWGNLIFKADKLYNGWDGRANGGKEMAQQDVYVWKVVCKDLIEHKQHKYVGHVTLVR